MIHGVATQQSDDDQGAQLLVGLKAPTFQPYQQAQLPKQYMMNNPRRCFYVQVRDENISVSGPVKYR